MLYIDEHIPVFSSDLLLKTLSESGLRPAVVGLQCLRTAVSYSSWQSLAGASPVGTVTQLAPSSQSG